MLYVLKQKHIALPLQGEVLSLRINPDMDMEAHSKHQIGVLWFDDGSMKGLACYINLVGLVVLDQQGNFRPEDLAHPRVQTFIQSLLQIATIFKSDVGTSSLIDSQISMVVKQNQDSQAQAISSFGNHWRLSSARSLFQRATHPSQKG